MAEDVTAPIADTTPNAATARVDLSDAIAESLDALTKGPSKADAPSTPKAETPSNPAPTGEAAEGRIATPERTDTKQEKGDSGAPASDPPRAESGTPFKAFQSEEELKTFIRAQSNREWDTQANELAQLRQQLKASQLTNETLYRTVAKAKEEAPKFVRDIAAAAAQGVDGASIYQHASEHLDINRFEMDAVRESQQAYTQREAQEAAAAQQREAQSQQAQQFYAQKEAATKPLYLETRAELLETALPLGLDRAAVDEAVKAAWADPDIADLLADWNDARDLTTAEKIAARTYRALQRVAKGALQERAITALDSDKPRTRPDRTTSHGNAGGGKDADPLTSVPFKSRGVSRIADALSEDLAYAR